MPRTWLSCALGLKDFSGLLVLTLEIRGLGFLIGVFSIAMTYFIKKMIPFCCRTEKEDAHAAHLDHEEVEEAPPSWLFCFDVDYEAILTQI